jgi:hypothetical protein
MGIDLSGDAASVVPRSTTSLLIPAPVQSHRDRQTSSIPMHPIRLAALPGLHRPRTRPSSVKGMARWPRCTKSKLQYYRPSLDLSLPTKALQQCPFGFRFHADLHLIMRELLLSTLGMAATVMFLVALADIDGYSGPVALELQPVVASQPHSARPSWKAQIQSAKSIVGAVTCVLLCFACTVRYCACLVVCLLAPSTPRIATQCIPLRTQIHARPGTDR